MHRMIITTQNIESQNLTGKYVLELESDGTYRVTVERTGLLFGYYHAESYGNDFAKYMNHCHGGNYVRVSEISEG